METNSIKELPRVIEAMINSQNNKDSAAFVACFDEKAKVFDEGEYHVGQVAIKTWNEYTSKKYDTQNELLDYKQSDTENILSLNVSGNFEGSPITLYYHLVIVRNLITNLYITSK